MLYSSLFLCFYGRGSGLLISLVMVTVVMSDDNVYIQNYYVFITFFSWLHVLVVGAKAGSILKILRTWVWILKYS